MMIKSLLLGLCAALAFVHPSQAQAQQQQQQQQHLRPNSRFSPGCSKDVKFDNGLHNITVNGTVREYIVRLPDDFVPSMPYKLVVALHWYGGTMNDVASDAAVKYGQGAFFGLLPLAGESTIFVAPNGFNKAWMNPNNTDFDFLNALNQELANTLCIDLKQRFAIGFSFGGSMAYALANSRTDTYRAVGILSGTDFLTWQGTPSPMPVFVSHGVSDPANPIAKGRLMRDHFLEINGCLHFGNASEPAVGSGTHISTFYWFCTSGKKVEFVAFDGVHQFSPMDKGQTESYLPWKIWEFFMLA